MKTTLWVLLFLCTSVLCAEVLFYDDFNRTEGGSVGNNWVNIGPVNPIIENGAMKIVSSSLQGARRDFVSLGITSGIYYANWDWKVSSNSWLADAFPNGTITYLRHDYEGNLFYDNTSDFSNPITIGSLEPDTWASFKLKVNIDTDRFSLWINNNLVADNIAGLAVTDFTRFTFRAGSGSTVTQYIDNFIVYNDIPPASPTNLTATGTVNDISLSWTGSPQDFLTYKIYRKTSSPADVFLAEVPGTQTNYTDLTAAANTDYFYRVKAVSMNTIESSYSNGVMAHLQPQANIEPNQITFNVGYGYSDSTNVTIYNTGNYPLNWQIGIDQPLDIPTNGLVAFYPFNGSTINATGLNQYDAINSGASFASDRHGYPMSAMNFNGIDSYLHFNEDIMFNNEMTISCWVYQRSVSYAPGIVSRYTAWSLFGRTDSSPGVRFYSGPGSSGLVETVFSLNQWHHVVVTSDSNTNRLYIDGVLVSQSIATGLSNSGDPMFIGKYWTGGYYWDGKIDDVAIYNTALNLSEVSALYYTNIPPYSLYGLVCLPSEGVIEDYGSQSVKIKLDGADLDVGTYIDTLLVTTNDPENQQHEIIVTINIFPPNPIITPQPINITLNAENQSYQTNFLLTNNGSGKLIYTLYGDCYQEFSPNSGIIDSGEAQQTGLTINGQSLADGIHICGINLSASGIPDTLLCNVIVSVDYTPPLVVSNIASDGQQTDANQIGITWSANAVADSVVAYKIYRRGRDETNWRLLSTVPTSQLWYIDRQFTGLDSTYVYYQVLAEDWVGNLSAEGESLQAALERFLAPDNPQITNVNNRDVLLSWDPVTLTISGLPGTPSCYVIYKSQYASPITDFDFLAVSFEEEYTHQWVLNFQPIDRLFYIITAYGGNMNRMNELMAQRREWKYGELEKMLDSSETSIIK